MPSKQPTEQATQSHLSAEAFFRSINIRYDAEHPVRIAHFQPTTKSVSLLNALAGEEADRAFLVVAPYGSGKSLTAAYLLHLVENRQASLEMLKAVGRKLLQVNPALEPFIEEREQRRGLVLALHGYCRSLGESLKDAMLASMARLKLEREARNICQMPCDDMDQTIELLAEVRQEVSKDGCDRVLILWDEFGRHLESLLAEGRPAALIEIQMLAEFVSRSQDVPMTLGLLLHQELLQYAGNMPQSVRAEWKKIEGRFRTIQYVDDSKEVYRLIGEIVCAWSSAERPIIEPFSSAMADDKQLSFLPEVTASSLKEEARTSAAVMCKQLGLFTDFTERELETLLERAYPLEPITLYLLPRLSARVAQNERTLFTFLYNVDLQTLIGLDLLYDYFSPSMRSDTAVGGTYRQWLETQGVLAEVGDDADAVKTLKIACLLGLGTSGERSLASRNLLLFALHGYTAVNDAVAVIDKLIQRKLLLHRKHSDKVSVWHGTDADLRGRLEEEKRRQRDGFNFLDFLSQEARPPAWRPVRYNDDFCIRRYLAGEYHSLETFKAYLGSMLSPKNLPVGCDGKVLYVFAETTEELREAELAARDQLKHNRLLLAIPREPLPLFDTALEVWCLLQMQLDADLVGSDPFVLSELKQMVDDARSYLQKLTDRLAHPGPYGPRWFYQGRELEVESPRDLRKMVSDVMYEVYRLTPKINNEMIVRNKPSLVVINARKKLLLGILERSGQENLGIKGNFPDASMFRTVLLHTGLYHRDAEGRWSYASPDDIEDPELHTVWEEIRAFLTVPAAEPKDLRQFFNELREPPFGVRAGLLPILFAAGLKAFPSALSLTKAGAYVSDILPSEIELLCQEPELYQLVVLDLNKAERTYLREFYRCFSSVAAEEIPEADLIRACFDALESWKVQLPPAALLTRRVSDYVRRFQTALRQPADPVGLLLEKIPEACGYRVEQLSQLLKALAACKKELMDVVAIYRDHVAVSVRRALGLGHQDAYQDVRETASRWANCFSDDFIGNLTDGIAKGLLSRMQMPYDSDEKLLESLSSLLVGRPLSRWDDSTVAVFDREIQDVVHRIEEAALSAEMSLMKQGVATQGLAKLIHGRMTELFNRLVNLVGPEEAETLLSSVLQTERSRYGDD